MKQRRTSKQKLIEMIGLNVASLDDTSLIEQSNLTVDLPLGSFEVKDIDPVSIDAEAQGLPGKLATIPLTDLPEAFLEELNSALNGIVTNPDLNSTDGKGMWYVDMSWDDNYRNVIAKRRRA